MTREHDTLRDLIAPVAVGAAEPHETARVEAHAERCAACGEELASLRAAAAALAIAVPQHDPPPSLKASLMSTVRAEAAGRAAGEAASEHPRPRRAGRGRRVLGIPAWPAAGQISQDICSRSAQPGKSCRSKRTYAIRPRWLLPAMARMP